MKTATKSKAVFAGISLAGLAAAVLWWPSVPPPITASQILAMLPPGSSVHSLVRLEMDGRGPAEAAVVARIPSYPGAREYVPTALVYRYARLSRRYREAYRAPSPGAVPFSADAGPATGSREAALFSGLDDDGALRYRFVGLTRGRAVVLREARVAGALRPDGIPPAPPAVVWRYAVRGGTVLARTSVVRLRPRQPLRVVAVGGGPASVVLPDSRFDVVESGYRQRTPGTYRIRIVTGFTPPEAAYVLTVIVEP